MPRRADVSTVIAHGVDAGAVAFDARQMPARGPSAVAVHDDGHVPRQAGEVKRRDERLFGRPGWHGCQHVRKGHGRVTGDLANLSNSERGTQRSQLPCPSIPHRHSVSPAAGSVCPAARRSRARMTSFIQPGPAARRRPRRAARRSCAPCAGGTRRHRPRRRSRRRRRGRRAVTIVRTVSLIGESACLERREVVPPDEAPRPRAAWRRRSAVPGRARRTSGRTARGPAWSTCGSDRTCRARRNARESRASASTTSNTRMSAGRRTFSARCTATARGRSRRGRWRPARGRARQRRCVRRRPRPERPPTSGANASSMTC